MIEAAVGVIRKVGPGDVLFLLEAQNACRFELDEAGTGKQLVDAIMSGHLEGFIYEGQRGCVLVCAQVQWDKANLCCLYRRGRSTGLREIDALWQFVQQNLRDRGVRRIGAFLSPANPKYETLARLYRRLGLYYDLMRVSKEL